ncbi:MAG: MFS transporter [Promethearchaeota archaeon]
MESKRVLIFVSILSFIGDFANSMLDVLYVFYAVSLGLSPGTIGWIISIYGITYLITPVIIGPIIDRLPRKTSLLIATSGQTLITLTYIFMVAIEPPSIFYLILVGQVIRATAYAFFWPTIQVLYSEIAEGNHRQHERNISLFCISWSLGVALGAFFAGIFGEWVLLGGFITASALYAIMFVLVFLGIPASHISTTSTGDFTRDSTSNPKGDSKSKCSEKLFTNPEIPQLYNHSTPSNLVLWLILLGTLVFAVISKGILAYFPNYAVITDGLNLSEFLSGQIIFAFGIGRFFGFLAGQWISNSFTKLVRNTLMAGVFLVTVIFTNISWILMGELLIIGYVVGRIYYIALELTLKHHSHDKGAKAGLFEGIVGLGTGISPLIAGWLAEWNLIAPFLFFSVFALISGGIMRWLGKSLMRQEASFSST